MTEQQQPQAPTTGPDAPSPAPEPTPVVIVGDQRDQALVEPRDPAPAPKFEPPKGTPDSGRFAAYDTTLGKYVGGVHNSRGAADKAGKAEAQTYKIVEV